ncbi:MAG: S1C family serine protease [Sorangiineae bacterium]|nr:S1C family serine protease [Polyangiaceae bacterium]MEB2323030.1 S1C family serine protease [Sorangiineae bacterium]
MIARTLSKGAAGAAALLSLALGSSAGAEPQARPAPPRGPASASSGSPDAAAREDAAALERARQGVVLLERKGRILGLGTVLAKDGRILTALSPLSSGKELDARFADGSVVRVQLAHSDPAWDLALLVPESGRWAAGLAAARAPVAETGSTLRSFSLAGRNKLALSRVAVKGQSTLRGGSGELAPGALELARRLQPTELGGPIIDDAGAVVAVLAKACATGTKGATAPCARAAYGVPVSTVKAFLRTVPASAAMPAPWLGVQGVADAGGPARGVRVLVVPPESQAAGAGLRGGADPSGSDVIIAVDDLPVASPEELAARIGAHGVGDRVELLVFGGDKFRRVTVTLTSGPGAAPPKRANPPAPSPPIRRPLPIDDPGY